MDTGIGVGLIIVAVTGSSIYIWNSNYFSHTQKVVLLFCFLFPPAQWVLGIIIGLWNKYNNSTIGFKIDSAKKRTRELKKLKKFGVISEQEYKEKSDRIISVKQDELFLKSEEYKSLKRLKDNDILTQREFEEKYKILKNKILEQIDQSELTLAKKSVNQYVSKVNPRDLIGVWKYENNVFEFWRTGFFIYKTNKMNIIKGSWLFKDNDYVIKLKKSNLNITPIEIENQKLKISLNSDILICDKIKDEV